MPPSRRTGPAQACGTGQNVERQQRLEQSVPRSADNLVLTRHRDIEAEAYSAYLDGFAAGLHEANVRMTAAIDEMLGGPDGYGLEIGPVSAKEAIRRMLRGLVGVS